MKDTPGMPARRTRHHPWLMLAAALALGCRTGDVNAGRLRPQASTVGEDSGNDEPTTGMSTLGSPTSGATTEPTTGSTTGPTTGPAPDSTSGTGRDSGRPSDDSSGFDSSMPPDVGLKPDVGSFVREFG